MSESKQPESAVEHAEQAAIHAERIAEKSAAEVEQIRHMWESQHTARRTNFILNIAVPVMSALIIGLGTWVWRTSQEIVLLHSELNQVKTAVRNQINHVDDKITRLRDGTVDRYTGTRAARDRGELLSAIARVEARLDKDMDRIENQLQNKLALRNWASTPKQSGK